MNTWCASTAIFLAMITVLGHRCSAWVSRSALIRQFCVPAAVAPSVDFYHQQLCKHKAQFSEVNEAQWMQLARFCCRLAEWNEKVNLVSRRDVAEIVDNHVIPSLSISLVHKFSVDETIVDVGCGGGFPGLPLSIIAPQARFSLVDSQAKKLKVVESIASDLELQNVRVIHCRAESLRETFHTILGRAVAAVPTFLDYSAHLQSNTSATGLWYLKGGDFRLELATADIRDYSLYPVQDAVASLQSDKFVLHIPPKEVRRFATRNLRRQGHPRS